MNKEKLTYTEETGLFFEKMGLTRMAGRIMGFLMICDKDAVSFEEIRQTLHASKGSISGNMNMLINTGFVETTGIPGDRKTYYRVSRMRVGELLRQRIRMFEAFAGLIRKGSDLKTREDEVSEWMDETARFYSWIQSEIHQLIDKWEDQDSGS